MKRYCSMPLLAVCVAGWLAASATGRDAAGSRPSVVRLDPRLDHLVPRDVVIERIADGFAWTEGPVWDRRTDSLLFSDVPNNVILRWTAGAPPAPFLKVSGYSGSEPFAGREPGSNGLAFDSEGRLTFAQHGDRRISRLEKDGSRTTVVDRYTGRRLNSPNDIVFKSNGDLYFTDPPFGLPGTFNDPGRELDFQGVFRYGEDGRLTLLNREMQGPNGIAFSPDEKTLYVTDAKRTLWLSLK